MMHTSTGEKTNGCAFYTSWSGFNMPTLNKTYCIVLTEKLTKIFFRLFTGYLSLEHKYKARSKLRKFAFGNEGTRVACKSLRSASCFTRFSCYQCPLISQCKQKSVLQSFHNGAYCGNFYNKDLISNTYFVIFAIILCYYNKASDVR